MPEDVSPELGVDCVVEAPEAGLAVGLELSLVVVALLEEAEAWKRDSIISDKIRKRDSQGTLDWLCR